MTALEFARTVGYAVTAPALLYFAFIHWNQGHRSAAMAIGGFALFFSLLMAGLVLVTYFEPVSELLTFNSAVVVFFATATVYSAIAYRYRKGKVNRNLVELDEIIQEMKDRQGRLSV